MVLRAAEPAASCGWTVNFAPAKREVISRHHAFTIAARKNSDCFLSSHNSRGGVKQMRLLAAMDSLPQHHAAPQQLRQQIDPLLAGPELEVRAFGTGVD